MASINEVMSHKNRDPKWMTDSQQQQQPGEVVNNKQTGSKEKEVATQPKAPKAPEIPQTHFRVRMCCNKCEEKATEEAGEVAGVVSVITDQSQSRVTVLGRADSTAVLKKLKRHVDKKATLLPAEQPVAKVVLPAQNVSEGREKLEKVGPKGSGEKKTEKPSKSDMKSDRGYNDDDEELAGGHGSVDNGPGMNRPAKPTGVEKVKAGPRMVDPGMSDAMRADPRMVDPRMLDAMRADPRMVDPRMLDAMRADPRMVDPRMLDAMRADPRMMDPRMVDPRQVRGGPPVDPREMRAPPVDPRGMRGSAEVREGWLVDLREMRGTPGHGDMRSEMRPSVDPREKIRSAEMKDAGQHADPKEIRTGPTDHMREMRQWPLDVRELQAYEYVSAADRRREMQQHPSMDPYDSGYSFNPREMRAQLPQESYYMSNNKSQEILADSQYQPKASYFSDYRPSQSYPANYSSAGSYYDDVAVTNPNYMKQVLY